MERLPVDSSLIAALAHDDETNTLEVEFVHEGAVYQYSNVTPELYIEMMQAESVGKWFSANIRKQPGLYPYRRVEV